MIGRFINKCCLFGVLSVFCAATSFAASITVTDIAGREVIVNAPVSRVMLADSRVLVALNILHPQSPLKGIIAWDDALIKKAPDLSTAYSKKFPELSKIPVFPNPYTADFSVEKALVAQPDLLIFDIGLKSKLTESGTLSLLEKSGLPVIFIDFRQYPLKNTMPSMALLGKVFGEEQQAEAFNQFYQQRLDLIRSKVATLDKSQRPSVFIERAAGISGEDYCCKTFGNGNFGEFVETAGGNNLGSQWFSIGMGGEINEEQLIHSNPDYYLMTAADWDTTRKGSASVPLGYTGDKAKSQARLIKLMERPKLRSLAAYQNKQVLALYQQYYDTPFNIIAVEAIAKFLHPNLFAELDPQADSDYLHKTFTALDGDGVFWVKAQ
ncbi:ABC transporter substrate-binding protein [Providencia vermicola]|uniref:ABC transporter substrate-binding protein n=1 Tax=Providencia vermicola TaxID=333965 RepID=UPI003D2BF541